MSATGDVFRALADPTRRAILTRVAAGPQPVNVLAEGFAMSRPAVSKHLRVLAQAGLVAMAPGAEDARQRVVTAELGALAELEGYLADLREVWERRLDGLGEVLGADD